MMLDHLGFAGVAAKVEAAVAADLAARGSALRPTREVGDAIVHRVTA
jgi:3-isopropylmalate dehydrogenase